MLVTWNNMCTFKYISSNQLFVQQQQQQQQQWQQQQQQQQILLKQIKYKMVPVSMLQLCAFFRLPQTETLFVLA